MIPAEQLANLLHLPPQFLKHSMYIIGVLGVLTVRNIRAPVLQTMEKRVMQVTARKNIPPSLVICRLDIKEFASMQVVVLKIVVRIRIPVV